MNLLQKNYRTKRYEPIDLRKMPSNSIDPFDLMSKNNLKPPAHGRYILSAQDGTYHKLEELNDLELKSFRRAIDLYLWVELTVGNLMHPREPPLHPYFTMADKINY